ncbi:hypothetical protein BofuT4_uP033930.1 [Botrytis cinerea T4]|uniref:Uncharacterized protein n=1 Tax=Botryotinia fuckeliana (strain T4) TaxID=999810 RepID=G2Y823_BOTF4|nr:hypothetical protein BofuT4_uP033930.1 [Botrytis cinerea T4]
MYLLKGISSKVKINLVWLRFKSSQPYISFPSTCILRSPCNGSSTIRPLISSYPMI